MTDQNHNPSRREFLHAAVGAAVLSQLIPSNKGEAMPQQTTGTTRRVLDQPGPMIPPVPAILLTVNGMPGDPEEISVLWTFVLNGKPPQIGVCAHNEHIAQKLIDTHKEFVLNVPVVGIAKAFDIVDMNSSKVGDKYKLAGLTRGKAMKVNAPTIVESPIQLECRVFNSLILPPERRIFLAEVVATTVLSGVCDDKGRLVVGAVPFFGMTAGSGEFYTMGKLVGHIGQSVGRSDIRY